MPELGNAVETYYILVAIGNGTCAERLMHLLLLSQNIHTSSTRSVNPFFGLLCPTGRDALV